MKRMLPELSVSPSVSPSVAISELTVPRFGIGTWRMGEDQRQQAREVAAITYALDRGVRLIDTAEMYGEGGAERLIGEAIRNRRAGLTIVSKVYPHNASERGVIAACERSLKRLGIDQIDLYLLHWRGSVPLAETVRGFEALKRAGKIKHWGVSNFDSDDMDELGATSGGAGCGVNQVLYHLGERGIEFDLAPAMARARIPIMAYSPLGQGPLLRSPHLAPLAEKHGVTPAAIALAFVLRDTNMIAIPKATSHAHVDENLAACGVVLDDDDRHALDRAFPPPRRKQSLAMT